MKKRNLIIGLIISSTFFIKAEVVEVSKTFPLYQKKQITKEDLIIGILKNKKYILKNIESTKMLNKVLLEFFMRSTISLKSTTMETRLYKTFSSNSLLFFKECRNPYRKIIDKKFKKQEKNILDNFTKKELDELLTLYSLKSDLSTNISINCGYLYQKAMNNFHEIKKIDKLAIKITKDIMSSYPRIK